MSAKERSQYIEDSKLQYTMREMKKNTSAYVLALPYFLLFILFTGIPVIISLPIGFTNFNMAEFPKWTGLSNFYTMFLADDVFLIAIQNTLVFAIITGPVSYILCFLLAWLINEMPGPLKTIFTYIFYAPTLAGNIYATWQLIFSGDSHGPLNAVLMNLGIIKGPQQWLTDARYIMMCIIIVQMWMSLGAGFLALRAGLQGIDKSGYEAGAIEGIKNRFQELIYITVPAMGPQLLFAAVMQITASFTAGDVGRFLTAFPTTEYKGHTLMTHAFDYGSIRFEMGYACAVCFFLFVVMLIVNNVIRKAMSGILDT